MNVLAIAKFVPNHVCTGCALDRALLLVDNSFYGYIHDVALYFALYRNNYCLPKERVM